MQQGYHNIWLPSLHVAIMTDSLQKMLFHGIGGLRLLGRSWLSKLIRLTLFKHKNFNPNNSTIALPKSLYYIYIYLEIDVYKLYGNINHTTNIDCDIQKSAIFHEITCIAFNTTNWQWLYRKAARMIVII